MRVLITGAAGFVGRHLLSASLGYGAAVVGLGRTRPDAELCDRLAEFVVADLADPAATVAAIRAAAPDRVFHLAGEASVAASWGAAPDTVGRNLATTLNLLEAVRVHAPNARVLVACSGEEYGAPPAERLPVAETEPLRPQSPYAFSKAAVDLLGGFYADAYGLAVVRMRAFNHCGPGQSQAYVVAAFAAQIAAAESAGHPSVVVTTGDLRPRRDFTDVRDVVRAYWLALERAAPGVYNVCSGRSTPIADILAGLAAHAQLALDQRTDPTRLRSNEVMDVHGSHDKLTGATGWQPEIPLERTLGETLDWWRERATVGAGR